MIAQTAALRGDVAAIQERLRRIASACLEASRSRDPRVIAVAFELIARAARDLEEARAALGEREATQ
jgi:hypothetical protein